MTASSDGRRADQPQQPRLHEVKAVPPRARSRRQDCRPGDPAGHKEQRHDLQDPDNGFEPALVAEGVLGGDGAVGVQHRAHHHACAPPPRAQGRRTGQGRSPGRGPATGGVPAAARAVEPWRPRGSLAVMPPLSARRARRPEQEDPGPPERGPASACGAPSAVLREKRRQRRGREGPGGGVPLASSP